jgi:hypothetical protein
MTNHRRLLILWNLLQGRFLRWQKVLGTLPNIFMLLLLLLLLFLACCWS